MVNNKDDNNDLIIVFFYYIYIQNALKDIVHIIQCKEQPVIHQLELELIKKKKKKKKKRGAADHS